MKKICITLVVFLLLNASSVAQAAGFNVGFARLKTNLTNAVSRTELTFGLFEEVSFAMGLGFRPELNFILDSNESFYVPLNLTYSLLSTGVARVYLFGGPEVQFVAGAPTGTESLIFSIDVGVGGEFDAGGLLFGASARYSHGLTDVLTTSVLSSKTRYLFFLAHVVLPF